MIGSLEGLLEQHAWAALRISGADQSAWNGEIIEAGEGIMGLAHWDGTLHLDRESILDPLRDLYAHAGKPRTDAELTRCRDALLTLLHEQSHFLGPTGATQEAAHAAFKLPGGRALEEGVAEAWAHAHLDDYIRELEIDKVAPGILDVRSEPSYAAFVPAVRLFTADIDRQTGSVPGQTLHLLNRETAEGQWRQTVALIYNSSRLPDLVPSDEAPAVRLHLEEALRTSFRGLELYEPFPRGFAASRSHAATKRLLTFLHQHLTTTERRYTPTARPTHIHLTPPTPRPTQAHLTPATQLPAPPPPLAQTPATTPEPHTQPSTTRARPTTRDASSTRPAPASPQTEALHAASTNSPQAAAIHHAFAGLTPPTARAPAPSNAPPQPAAATTALQLEP